MTAHKHKYKPKRRRGDSRNHQIPTIPPPSHPLRDCALDTSFLDVRIFSVCPRNRSLSKEGIFSVTDALESRGVDNERTGDLAARTEYLSTPSNTLSTSVSHKSPPVPPVDWQRSFSTTDRPPEAAVTYPLVELPCEETTEQSTSAEST